MGNIVSLPATWFGLIRTIFTDTFGPVGGPAAMLVASVELGLLGLAPLILIGISWSLFKTNLRLAAAQNDLTRLQERQGELRSHIRELSGLVANRFPVVPPPAPFRPEAPDATREPEKAADTTADGQSQYNYCSSCKSIQFIKFSRCQSCGFHVLVTK
jgi:hypothetical protein